MPVASGYQIVSKPLDKTCPDKASPQAGTILIYEKREVVHRTIRIVFSLLDFHLLHSTFPSHLLGGKTTK